MSSQFTLYCTWFDVIENKQQLSKLIGCGLTRDAEIHEKEKQHNIHKLVDTGKKAILRIGINTLMGKGTVSLCTHVKSSLLFVKTRKEFQLLRMALM